MDILVAKNFAVGAALADGQAIVCRSFRDLNFALAPGRILGLVGESGAGKSMIGRAVAQLLPHGFAVTGGELMFDGQDLVRMPADEAAGTARPRDRFRAAGAAVRSQPGADDRAADR